MKALEILALAGFNATAEPFQWNYTDSASQNIAITKNGPKLQALRDLLFADYMFVWYYAIGAGLASFKMIMLCMAAGTKTLDVCNLIMVWELRSTQSM